MTTNFGLTQNSKTQAFQWSGRMPHSIRRRHCILLKWDMSFCARLRRKKNNSIHLAVAFLTPSEIWNFKRVRSRYFSIFCFIHLTCHKSSQNYELGPTSSFHLQAPFFSKIALYSADGAAILLRKTDQYAVIVEFSCKVSLVAKFFCTLLKRARWICIKNGRKLHAACMYFELRLFQLDDRMCDVRSVICSPRGYRTISCQQVIWLANEAILQKSRQNAGFLSTSKNELDFIFIFSRVVASPRLENWPMTTVTVFTAIMPFSKGMLKKTLGN